MWKRTHTVPLLCFKSNADNTELDSNAETRRIQRGSKHCNKANEREVEEGEKLSKKFEC